MKMASGLVPLIPLVALFFAVPAAAQDVLADKRPSSGYDGGFYIASEDGRFALKIKGRVQTRYDHLAPEEGLAESAFFIRRARLKLKGHAHSPDLQYMFQASFEKGEVTLKDFVIDYRLRPLNAYLRAGQWKRPFSRHFINSGGKLELVSRSITHDFFGAGRDIGIALHNNYEKSPPFEWVVGFFNGTGVGSDFSGDVLVDPMTGEGEVVSGGFSNVPARLKPAVVARVGYNYNGIKGYSEADLEGGPLRFAVGASALASFDADDEDQTSLRGELDYTVKAYGLSSGGAVYVSRPGDGDFSGMDQEAVGFRLQLGYLFSGRYQPAVRYAFISPKGLGGLHEARAGFSVYLFDHSFKWQTDAGVLVSEIMGESRADLLLRTMLQLDF